jgi:hypothetical protein
MSIEPARPLFPAHGPLIRKCSAPMQMMPSGPGNIRSSYPQMVHPYANYPVREKEPTQTGMALKKYECAREL